MDCRNGGSDTAASPRGLRRITGLWRCNRGKSSVLLLTHAHAHDRDRFPKSSPGETPGCPTGKMPVLRSLLKFIACGFGLVLSFGHDANFFLFVINEGIWGPAVGEKNVRADRGIRANYSVAAHDRGASINADAVFNRRMAFFPAQALSRPKRARDEGHALVKFH